VRGQPGPALSGLLAGTLLAGPLAAQDSEESGPIADNSFLIEEAYNQEAGVVQHISNFIRPDGGGGWAYTFTQEWPFHGQTHQLSYAVPVLNDSGSGTGLGDILLNYRYQLVADGDDGLHVAPRLSFLLPTGSEDRGRGAGGLGIQTNIPVSLRPHSWLALHGNAGLTWTPSAQNAAGESASTLGINLGGSAIWLLRPTFNLMLELLWLSTEDVVGPDQQDRQSALFLNPGARWAFNFHSGLQIVPGVAYTLGLNDTAGNDGLFLYLSFEHPFRHVESP
jgi:Putative MetA-pathway of phenol degradation